MPINNNCCRKTCCGGNTPPDTLQVIFSGVIMCPCSFINPGDARNAGYYKVISGSLNGIYCVTRTATTDDACQYILVLDTPIVVGRYSSSDPTCGGTLLESLSVTTIYIFIDKVFGPGVLTYSIDVQVTSPFSVNLPILFNFGAESTGPFLFCDEGTYDNSLTGCVGINTFALSMGYGGTLTIIPDNCP